jgi:TusA-related sulfurtransferase
MDTMDSGAIKVLVSHTAARENVSRLAENKGWRIEVTEQGEDILLLLQK